MFLIMVLAMIVPPTLYIIMEVVLNDNRNGPEEGGAIRFEGGAVITNDTIHHSTPGVHTLYLEGHNTNAGLGHSFMSFHHLTTLAFEHNLTTRISYTSSGHGVDGARVKDFFFGDLMMTPFATGPSCRKIVSSPVNLTQDVSQIRNELKNASSIPGCVVFITDNVVPQEHNMGSFISYYRRLFQLNERTRNSVIARKFHKNTSDIVNVAVHIRRGDLFRYVKSKGGVKRQAAEQRLFSVSAYTSVLGQLVSKLEKLGDNTVNIYIYCEGMTPPALVQEVNGTYVDIRKAVRWDSSIQNVTFVRGDEDSLQAFDDMCLSDVLITGASGFSHLVSILCQTPVVLAIPFWHSYNYIPNALMLDTERQTFLLPNIEQNFAAKITCDAKFNESQFEELWQQRTRQV